MVIISCYETPETSVFQDQYQFLFKCVAHYCREALGLPLLKDTEETRNEDNFSPPVIQVLYKFRFCACLPKILSACQSLNKTRECENVGCPECVSTGSTAAARRAVHAGSASSGPEDPSETVGRGTGQPAVEHEWQHRGQRRGRDTWLVHAVTEKAPRGWRCVALTNSLTAYNFFFGNAAFDSLATSPPLRPFC